MEADSALSAFYPFLDSVNEHFHTFLQGGFVRICVHKYTCV